MKRTILLCSFLCCLASLLAPSMVSAEVKYRLVPTFAVNTMLPPTGGMKEYTFGINDLGDVAGYRYNQTTYTYEALKYSQGVVTVLGDLNGGGTASRALAINKNGYIVGQGSSSYGFEAVEWVSAGAQGLGDLAGGSFNSTAIGINNSQQVVGCGTSATGTEACTATSGGMTGLGFLPGGTTSWSCAYDINDSSVIVGRSSVSGGYAAFKKDSLGMRALPNLAGSIDAAANAINSAGTIVGWSRSLTAGVVPCLWEDIGGTTTITNLGTTVPTTARIESAAFDVNDLGQVVGRETMFGPTLSSTGFVWDKSRGMRNLNSVLDETGTGWKIQGATGINDKGWIVGWATGPDGKYYGVLLFPYDASPSEYTLIDVGMLPGGVSQGLSGLNDKGEVSGGCSVNGSAKVFTWSRSRGLTDIGTFPGQYNIGSSGINDAGQVTGTVSLLPVNSAFQTYLWQDGTFTGLGYLSAYKYDLTRDINQSGQVTGYSRQATSLMGAYLYSPDTGMTYIGDLPGGSEESYGYALNNNGHVVGYSYSANGQEAFLYRDGQMTGLGDLPGTKDTAYNFASYAYGVNDLDQVVGYSTSYNGIEAFLWDNGVLTGLGNLPGTWFYSIAYDINNAGTIVGTSTTSPGLQEAFVRDSMTGQMRSLNGLLGQSGAGFFLSSANRINEHGQILASASTPTGMYRGVLVTPTGLDIDGDGTPFVSDCNDSDPAINPNAVEICDGIDNNCDGRVDEGFDADGDGYSICAGDCDDNNAAVHPGAVELCNGIDDNCNGTIDDGFDADGDGWTVCQGDCNDNNAAINPGAVELCNGIDDNCNGTIDEGFDLDGDGWTVCGGDCNDNNAAINPGAVELCNGIDDNCNGAIDESSDADGDGWTICGGDCNDNNAAVNPGAAETCGDLIDNNCNGVVDEGCTFVITPSAGAGGTINPGAPVTVPYLGSRTFTITPNANYKIADVKIDNVSAGAVSSYTFSNVTASHTIAATFAPYTVVTVVQPNGGEVLATGSTYAIKWGGPATAVKFNLSYSLNNGSGFTTIANGVTGYSYNWTVPVLTANQTQCLIKVIGLDARGKTVIATDTSDRVFTIEVVRVTSPNGGESWQVGSTYAITWISNKTTKAVNKVTLSYATDGGSKWTKIIDLTTNALTYSWKIPAGINSAQCRVKVNLFNGGTNLGLDASDANFSITP